MTMINLGRVRHLDSATVANEVREFARTGDLISDQAAATIASWYQSPGPRDMPMTLLAQGSEVDPAELIESIDYQRSSLDVRDRTDMALLALQRLAESYT
jgi:hypothetical protein